MACEKEAENAGSLDKKCVQTDDFSLFFYLT